METMNFVSTALSLKNGFSSRIAILIVVIVFIHRVSLIVYRLFFSSIAGFPGPKVAAITGSYEFYYDFWKSGRYVFEIEKMHKKYGLCILSSEDWT